MRARKSPFENKRGRKTKQPVPRPQLVTKKEAAAILACTSRTIERWIQDGTLKPVRLPSSTSPVGRGNIRFDLADLVALIEECKG